MITIEDYEALKAKHNFEEYPDIIAHPMTALNDFLVFKELSLDVKIHLCSMLVRRTIGLQGEVNMPYDAKWLMQHFMEEYELDATEFWKTDAYLKGLKLVQEEEMGSRIVGTTYLYTMIEAYLKHKLGYRFLEDDSETNKRLIKIGIGDAYIKVKKGNNRVSREFHLIDQYFKEQAVHLRVIQEDMNYVKLEGRLKLLRNLNLHGRNQFMVGEGILLSLLFALLHYCEIHELVEEFEKEDSTAPSIIN